MQTHDSKDLTVFMLDMILQKEEIILLHCWKEWENSLYSGGASNMSIWTFSSVGCKDSFHVTRKPRAVGTVLTYNSQSPFIKSAFDLTAKKMLMYLLNEAAKSVKLYFMGDLWIWAALPVTKIYASLIFCKN